MTNIYSINLDDYGLTLTDSVKFIIVKLVTMLLFILILLFVVGLLTVLERKVIGVIQRRYGTNHQGIYSLVQLISDGLKLFLKEPVLPTVATLVIFILASFMSLILGLVTWGVISFSITDVIIDLSIGVLYIYAFSSLNVYSVIFAGWASNSKYAFLGGLRSTAQMISYEVFIGLITIAPLFFSQSLNITKIILSQQIVWNVKPLLLIAIIFLIASFAETNRAPFDLPEAEAELVAGYNVEYSGMIFAFFFIGEYASILLMCALITILFLGGWLAFSNFTIFKTKFKTIWFAFKTINIFNIFLIVRAAFPRFRYDQLMRLGWKIFLPLGLGHIFMLMGIVSFF